MSTAGNIPPFAVIAAIVLPAPMLAAFALPLYAVHEIWAFLTEFGIVATPVGIGLAIAAHVLGKKLGTLVGRMDRIILSRERYMTKHELPSLSALLDGAIEKTSQAHAALASDNSQIDASTALLILPHLHAIRNAIISTRLPKLNNRTPTGG